MPPVEGGGMEIIMGKKGKEIQFDISKRIFELMEERGIVGPANGSKPREIIKMP